MYYTSFSYEIFNFITAYEGVMKASGQIDGTKIAIVLVKEYVRVK